MRKRTARLTVVQAFLAAAGGLILYLVPQDAKAQVGSPWRELYVLLLAAAVALTLLLLFKSYETVATAMLVSMVLVLAHYGIWSVQMGLEDAQKDNGFLLHLSYYDGICWGIICLVPFVICLGFRLFAQQKWDTVEKRVDFLYFFRRAGVAFGIYFAILLCSWFLLNSRVDFNGGRTIHWVPLGQIFTAFANLPNSFRYLLGYVLFFIPLGFLCSVLKPDWRWYQRLLLCLCFSVGIQLCQYALNTGPLDIDDVLLNLLGFWLGDLVKGLLDTLRLHITDGEERAIQYLPTEE